MSQPPIELPPELERTLREVLAVPAAPFHELWLAEAVCRRFAGKPGVTIRRDRFGNHLLQYRPEGSGEARLGFQAHLDHPGFVLTALRPGGRGTVELLGGMPRRMGGARIRFFRGPEDDGVCAVMSRTVGKGRDRRGYVRFEGEEVPPGTFGLLDLPAWRRDGDFAEGRAFDDALGVALLARLLEESLEGALPTPFDLLLTRGEEMGFIGASSLLAERTLPLPRYLVTVEMPRAGGDLRAGDGVMVRTADRMMNYDPGLLLWVQTLADRLTAEGEGFRAQRRLAWTGVTETSAFLLHGYRATALCLPVAYAHNIGPGSRPAPERVHLGDLLSLMTLLRRILREPLRTATPMRRLKRRLGEVAAARSHRLLGGPEGAADPPP